MLRADIDGAILLADDELEGRFWEKCTHNNARVVCSPLVAVELLADVIARGVAGVVATVRRHVSPKELPDSVFQPATGDVASLLIASTCFLPTFTDIGGRAWVTAIVKEVGNPVDRAVRLAWSWEQLRTGGFQPTATEFVEKYIDWTTFDVAVARINQRFGSKIADLADSLGNMASSQGARNLLFQCDGMIAIEILAASTSYFRPRGLQATQSTSPNNLLDMLRVAFNLADLESDDIFWQMRAWERRNDRYSLLKQWRILDSLEIAWDQRYWEPDLRRMLEHDTAGKGFTAIKMDLDNFKAVNEQLGHSAGDEAIRLAGSILHQSVLNMADVYRRGGDEFVVLSPGLRGEDTAHMAELIRSRIERTMATWGAERGLAISPTASIGVVDVDACANYEDVIRLLDEAQSRAKKEGKNRVVEVHCPSADSIAAPPNQ